MRVKSSFISFMNKKLTFIYLLRTDSSHSVHIISCKASILFCVLTVRFIGVSSWTIKRPPPTDIIVNMY